MSGEHLLDTNIVIALFENDEHVCRCMAESTAVYLPVIVMGELLYGAMKSSQTSQNVEKIQRLLESVSVLTCNQGTAENYGLIKHQLKVRGRPLPENDIWIASIAMQHSLTVISRDKHFQEVAGLKLEQW